MSPAHCQSCALERAKIRFTMRRIPLFSCLELDDMRCGDSGENSRTVRLLICRQVRVLLDRRAYGGRTIFKFPGEAEDVARIQVRETLNNNNEWSGGMLWGW